MPPAVSINLCCYNSEAFLQATLESISRQTFRDWELIVIDDGSVDSTGAIVQRFRERDPRIIYHRQQNAGLGAARNAAIERSSGKYIALIDHDDLWLPAKLEQQVRQMASQERLVLSYTDAEVIDERGRPLRPYMPADRSAEGEVGRELFLRDFIACSSVLIRRNTLMEAGTFRPELRIAEEYDVFLRLAERGSFGRIAEPLLRLRVHAGNASWNFVRGRDENRIVLSEALRRNPRLRDQVGRSAVRVRLAGFACSPREAAFLSGSFRKTTLRAALTASAKLILSFFPDLVTDRVLMATAARRRSTAMAAAD